MLTPEIIARVDAWLASHRDWVIASRDRQMLYCEWRLRSHSWEHLAEGSRAGVEAAMAGVLLALVMDGWGAFPDITGFAGDDGKDGVGVSLYRPDLHRHPYLFDGPSLELGLLSALEAAPR